MDAKECPAGVEPTFRTVLQTAARTT